jgi:hypothetical protein
MYEVQGSSMEEISALVDRPDDFKTKFGLTEPFLTDLKKRSVPKAFQGNFNTGMVTHPNFRKLKLDDVQTIQSIPTDPGELDFKSAIVAAYYGMWQKISLDEIAAVAPKLARVLFDFAFNAGAEKATKYLQETINDAFEEFKKEVDASINYYNDQLNSHEIMRAGINNELKRPRATKVDLKFSDWVHNTPEAVAFKTIYRREKWPTSRENAGEFKPLSVDGFLTKGGETIEAINYLIKIVDDTDLAKALLEKRKQFHETKSPRQFRKGLINRTRSLMEMLGIKDEDWRKNYPNFHHYIGQ